MNTKQRIVLMIGAAAFVYVIFTSPKISIVKGTYVIPPPDRKDIARTVDIRTAMTRAIAVLGATLFVSVALKDKKTPRTQSPVEKNLFVGGYQESERETARKDAVAKIVRFLKDFF